MSLAGLRYQATTFGTAPQETKSGSYVYHGTANGFHEWEFRTRIRVEFAKSKIKKKLLEQEAQKSETSTPERVRAGATPVRRRGRTGLRAEASEQDPADEAEGGNPDEEEEAAASGGEVMSPPFSPQPPRSSASVHTEVNNTARIEQLAGEIESMRAELVQKVLEGLRGDAYLVAQDLGVAKLMEDNGIDQLIDALKKMIFPLQALEAKELFRVGQQIAGPLARQTGESVTSYISRRRRWWRQVQELDNSMLISDGMRAELLIEAAGLSKHEQLMVRTAAKTPSFDAYAAVLLEHHGKIHLKDSRSLAPQQKSVSYGKGKSSGRGWSYQRVANWADADPEESWEDGQHEEWYGDSYNEWTGAGYVAAAPEDEEPEDEEQEFLEDEDLATALLAMAECDNDETPAEGLDELASAAQQLFVGYMAAGTHKGKSKGKGKPSGKGKFKGKGKHVFRTQLSVEDRVKRLKELKQRSKCLRCGGQGHWAGDPVCKFSKRPATNAPGQKSQDNTGYMALSDLSDSDGEYNSVVIGTTKPAEHTGFMGYRTPVSRTRRGPPSSEASDEFSVVSDSRKSNVRRTRAAPSAAAESMDSLPEGSETKFTFGQHEGLTYHEVMHKYPGYYVWGKEQKSPSRLLANFLDWATEHYEVDQTTHEIMPRLEPIGEVPRMPTSSHDKTKGCRKKPPHPPLEQCRKCVSFTGLGSNAYYQIRTCLDCGHMTKTKREPVYKNNPETCKHESIDRRGSSKFTARFFCKLCGTHVDEMPQSEARRRQQLSHEITTLPSAAIDTAERVIQSEKDDVCLTIEGAVQMMHMFQQDVETELQGSNGEPVRASVIYEILGNCIEAVREAAPEHCFMAVTELTPLTDVVTGPALRVIDIWTDTDVWGVLDEGCNSTVCGSEWLARATENYAVIGYDVVKVSDEGKPFKGLSGMTNTNGSYRIPFALTFDDPKQKLPGVMDTHVIDGKVPLLLSQHAQAALNLVKQMGSSIITVGVNGPKLEICRVKDSGLLCINLSSALKGLKEKKLPQNLKELRLPGLGNPAAYPAMASADPAPNVTIITCGKEFSECIDKFDRAPMFGGKMKAARDVVAEFGLSDRRTIIASTLRFGDPHHDPNLRSHVGCHPDILKGVFATYESSTAVRELFVLAATCFEPMAIVLYCNKNRHRSVAIGWLLASALRTDSPKAVKLIHHDARRSWSQMYGQCKGECDVCTHKTPEVREAANRCVNQLIELSRASAADKSVLSQVRGAFFEVKPSRPATVDLTNEFGAPVLAKAESRSIAAAAAGSATPAPATPAGSTPKAVALRPAFPSGARPTARAPPPAPPPAPPRMSRTTSARSRTPERTERPGSASDTAESRRREEALLETMRRMQDQIDDLREQRSRRSRTRSRSALKRRYRRSRSDSRRPRRYRDSRSRSREVALRGRRGRSPERDQRVPKTPPMPPPRKSARSTSVAREESTGSVTWRRWDSTSKRDAWPSYWRFPVIRSGRESWNRRVRVDGLPVEILDQLYWAGYGASRDRKGRSLRWIGPYYPGPDAGARQATQIAESNHESNIKICVLDEVQHNTSVNVDFSTPQMRAQEWQAVVYDYINEEWTRITDRVPCNEIPEWNQEAQTRILVFAPGDSVQEEEAEEPGDDGNNPPGDAPGDDGNDPPGDEGGGPHDETVDEEEILEEAAPGDDVPAHEMFDAPEAGHGTSYYVEGSSTPLAREPAQVPSGNIVLPEHESPAATPSEDQPTIVRALSDDSSVVGPFQTVDDVGDHPSCAVDPSQEFIKNLKEGNKHVPLSPTSDDEDSDVKVSHEPGVGPPLLEGMYSADVSNVTMSKGEKHAFVSGLSIMNEQDHVLTALVSNTPLNAIHLVVVSEGDLTWDWERPDVEVLHLDMDWQKTRKKLMHFVSKRIPGLMVAMFEQAPTPEVLHDLWDEMDLHGCGVVVMSPRHIPHTFPHACVEMRGDLTIYLGGKQMDDVRQDLLEWEHLGIAPRCFADVKTTEMMELLSKRSEERYLNSYTRTCFVGETIEDDEEEESPLMELEQFDDSLSPMEQEELHLDQLALPGSMDEQKRRALWRKLPQRTRIAIRRLHRQFSHPAPQTLRSILKAGRAPPELIEAARLVRCQACEDSKPKPRDHPVGNKFVFEFNACMGMDVAEARDHAGNKFSVLSFVDIATGFHVARVVKEGGGMPTSEACASAMMEAWVSWAGWPRQCTMDRGVHNRGEMQKLLASHGCEVIYAPLETPSAIGKVERAQGVMKAMLRKVVHDVECIGAKDFKTVLQEVLVAKNTMTRSNGYSPSQWVLGKNPRAPGSVTDLDEAGNLGVLETAWDPSAKFYLNHQSRMAAQKAFVHLDTSSRIARALTRNAAVQGNREYQVGDVVVYRRDTQQGGTQWSTACRVIGVDAHQGVWLLHEGVPILCAANKVRSANEAESLAYSLLHNIPVLPEVIVSGPQQQRYVRVADDPAEPSSSRGVKRTGSPAGLQDDPFEAKDKTGGKTSRAAPKTPGALEGDVMMAELEGRDHWRIGNTCAVRVHVEPRYAEYSPAFDGEVPEGFSAAAPCKVRKRFIDGTVKDCETFYCNNLATRVESQAWTGFTIFPRAQDPDPFGAMDRLEQGVTPDMQKIYNGFIAQRMVEEENQSGKVNKTLDYNAATGEMKKGMFDARAKEWAKYKSFDATVVVTGEEKEKLLAQGHRPIPSKWVDTMKNMHESHRPDFVPIYKARLVSCGNFEKVDKGEVRCDSPTSEPESHLVLASHASSRKWRLQSADITNAYFQAEPLTRLLLMSQPRGGLTQFDPEIPEDALLMCRVPIYGTKDAGRGFYLRMHGEIIKQGFFSSAVSPAMYYKIDNEKKLQALLCTHVDDLLFCHDGKEGKKAIENLLGRFSVGKIEESSFRYCGRRFTQSEDFTVCVDVHENTKGLRPIRLDEGRRPGDTLSAGELTSLRSVVGSLAWIARYGRPDIAYRVNELQKSCNPKGTVSAIKEANKTVELALQNADFKIVFPANHIDWTKDLAVVTFSDASFAGEAGYKSQQGRLHYIVNAADLTAGKHRFHLIGFSSSTMKRVCRATLQAEAYALQSAVESGDKIRALICEMLGKISMTGDWHLASQKAMKHLYFSDCRSLTDHLQSEVPRKIQDKRLGIELAALRQGIWADGELTHQKFSPYGDEVAWIDTGRQLADCLTKSMRPDYLVRVLNVNVMDVNVNT